MKQMMFAYPGNESLAESIRLQLNAAAGALEIRKFPDGESYVRIVTEVNNTHVFVVCSLYDPDPRFLSLAFLCRTMKDLGAQRVTLIAPYLPYLRQDKRFKDGEAVSNRYFADLVSSFTDGLITVDPHLHRIASLNEIYLTDCYTLQSSALIADYIRRNISKAFIIGPDSESLQWTSDVAGKAGAPFIVLEKTRKGDKEVSIEFPETDFRDHTPVILDDIISTGTTMIETIRKLRQMSPVKPVCIGIHALFTGGSYDALQLAGAADIVTSNTILHPSNKIDISSLIVKSIQQTEHEALH